MANIELKFLEGNGSYFTVSKTTYGDDEWEGDTPKEEIHFGGYDADEGVYFAIQLDKSTAIKFAKTLRTEINKIKD